VDMRAAVSAVRNHCSASSAPGRRRNRRTPRPQSAVLAGR
jgi:hypothetical protein